MKQRRIGVGASLLAVGFLSGYVVRGTVGRPALEPEAKVPQRASPKPALQKTHNPEALASRPISREERATPQAVPLASAAPIATPAAPSGLNARLEFPDGGFSPATFEARLRTALEACRPPGAHSTLSSLDCTEYPCIAYVSLSEGASLRAIADCPALTSLGSVGMEGMGPIDDAGTSLAALWVRPEGELGAEARVRIGERACGLAESYGATCDPCTRCLLGCLQ